MIGGDHAVIGGDHAVIGGDHGVIGGDHAVIGGDHAVIGGDHAVIGGDHAVIGGDHAVIRGDHAVIGGDHAVIARVSALDTRDPDDYPPFIDSIRIAATSGLENSGGGSSPRASISRTFVPDRFTFVDSSPGAVLSVPIEPTAFE